MRLAERLRGGDAALPTEAAAQVLDATSEFDLLKDRVHEALVASLDLDAAGPRDRGALEREVREALVQIASETHVPLNRGERARLVSELVDEVLGLGPLETLIRDPEVQDVLVNGPDDVYVERSGVLHRTDVRFRDAAHLRQVIDRIVAAVGRRVDEASPMVDARLADGSRVNVILPPLALGGPAISIRKFGRDPLGADDLLDGGAFTDEMQRYLAAAVGARLNVLISGGTGSGKTTLLNALSDYIPPTERILTIEDSAELRLRQPHVVTLESRPPNLEGRGEVQLSDLVKNSLRMRPDRIIVGEARGAEVMDMLQAMNTGHPGSMSTVHANNPRDALSRIEVMASMGTSGFSEQAVRRLIASAVDVVVQLARFSDGSRRIVSISEMVGMDGERARLEERIVFEQRGVDDEGRVFGTFRGLGEASRFEDRLAATGHALPDGLLAFEKASAPRRAP